MLLRNLVFSTARAPSGALSLRRLLGSSANETTAASPAASGVAEDHSDDWLREMSTAQRFQSDIDSRDSVVVPPRASDAIAHIHASSNNTVVTITTATGNALNWASSGSVGFKGAKRSTSFAAQTAGSKAGQVALEKGVSQVRVIIKGMGAGRASALKGLQVAGLKFVSITDRTPVPHNGCRPKKARRL